MKKNTSKAFRFPWEKNPTKWERLKASSVQAFDRVSKEVRARVDLLTEQVKSPEFIARAGTVVFGAGAVIIGVLQWLAVFMMVIALAKVVAGFVVMFWPLLVLSMTLLLAGLAIRASVIDNPLEGLCN